ncbi:related to neutral amino acid permease [Phialocephala subalpina]|uniref:Related to neutral amino acid permease n=1 Tax=Phialocephala subalpina TaxID=576137 RepID=A0A1L7XGJ1_9HELO|nr:related to neutral amino acid permease [Phialocephala subalpina]
MSINHSFLDEKKVVVTSSPQALRWVQFALGVLGIPTAFYSLGAVGGALSVTGWGALNIYTAVIQGDFRNRHPGCHTTADMAFYLGATSCVPVQAFSAMSTGINALSHHATCTVWWSVISSFAIALCGSVRKFHTMGWLMWAGFISIFTAVMIVVYVKLPSVEVQLLTVPSSIDVTTLDRPAAAPQTGDYELGYYMIAHATFIARMSTSATIFISSSALFLCMAIVNGLYLSFSLVVYRWSRQWVASPSLGSAGQTIKMISYGTGMVGLIASAVIYLYVVAKHIFAIPIFNYLLALTGLICFAPLSLILPSFFWLHDFKVWRTGTLKQKLAWGFHVLIILLGLFLTVAGTYSTVQGIVDAYAVGTIGEWTGPLSSTELTNCRFGVLLSRQL